MTFNCESYFALFNIYSTPVGEWEYCDEFICLSVCVSQNLLCRCPVWLWLGPPLAALHYVMYSFMDDVMFGPSGPYGMASGVAIPWRSLMSMNALF